MNIGLHWLLRYLQPGGLSADAVDHALTFAGFPIESRTALPSGDTLLDVEITSNRGDCLSHVGLAREVAAATGQAFLAPVWKDPRTGGTHPFRLVNEVPDRCPLFTARVMRGVSVGPSPAWLASALESIGQRPINNIVDVTNFITAELGNPCHVFDAQRIRGETLVVRRARPGEPLTTLDGRARKLDAEDIVVADSQGATSLAGVIGGLDSSVTQGTRDIVLEMATWDPSTVRRTARRHAVRTDASHRFERMVDARTIEAAAQRAAALIVEIAGGRLEGSILAEGRPLAPLLVVDLRPARCSLILGSPIPGEEIARILRKLDIAVEARGENLRCTIPAFRPDLEREIDLIEEVARIRGLDRVPVLDRLPIRAKAPQPVEVAARDLASLLAARGFFETVTFSFLATAHAEPFLPPGHSPINVDDERRQGEPTLRPSTLPSLLLCRRANHHAGNTGSLRFFETASAFSQPPVPGARTERRTLALLADVEGTSFEARQHSVRVMRGTIEAVGRAMAGPGASLSFSPSPPGVPAFAADAHATVLLGGERLGSLGLIDAAALRRFDLDASVVAAELDLEPLLALFPGRADVRPLPHFPPIERDLSLVVPEPTRWEAVRAVVERARPELLDGIAFVSTFRGKSLPKDRKSVTVRLRFRHGERTLRRDEVEPQVARVVEVARVELGAELRG